MRCESTVDVRGGEMSGGPPVSIPISAATAKSMMVPNRTLSTQLASEGKIGSIGLDQDVTNCFFSDFPSKLLEEHALGIQRGVQSGQGYDTTNSVSTSYSSTFDGVGKEDGKAKTKTKPKPHLSPSFLANYRLSLGVPFGGVSFQNAALEKMRRITLVAGGIGITPMLPLLDAICFRINEIRYSLLQALEFHDISLQRKLLCNAHSWLFKKVHLVWVVREIDLLELLWQKLHLCTLFLVKK